VIVPADQLDYRQFSSAMQSPIYHVVFRFVALSGSRFEKPRWMNRQVHKMAKAHDDSRVTRNCTVVLGDSFVQTARVCEGGEEGEDAMTRRPLVLSDSAGIGYSPQELSRSAMGCSYNGIDMSVVFVSGAQTG
jgi:hypothetical protein